MTEPPASTFRRLVPLAAPIQRLIALPFDRERYVDRVASVVKRYERMQGVAEAGPIASPRRQRIQLLFEHPSAWSELEGLDTTQIQERLARAVSELTVLRADAPLPAPPHHVDRTRVLAVADLEWLAREVRSLTRRARRLGVAGAVVSYGHAEMADAIDDVDEPLVSALTAVPRGRRMAMLRQVVAIRHQVTDIEGYLRPERSKTSSTRIAVGDFDKLRDGRAKRIDVEGRTIAVFKTGGCLYAIEDTCPHRGGPLGKGEVEDGHVFCPLHGWAFNLSTGAMRGNPNVTVKTFASGVDDDGSIWVDPESK